MWVMWVQIGHWCLKWAEILKEHHHVIPSRGSHCSKPGYNMWFINQSRTCFHPPLPYTLWSILHQHFPFSNTTLQGMPFIFSWPKKSVQPLTVSNYNCFNQWGWESQRCLSFWWKLMFQLHAHFVVFAGKSIPNHETNLKGFQRNAIWVEGN